jgi:hypothetical protein
LTQMLRAMLPSLFTRVPVGVALVLLVACKGLAQDRPVELGLDGSISFTFVSSGDGEDSENLQTWAFPLRRIRAGAYLADAIQAQVSSGFEVADYGGVSTVRFSLGLAGMYNPPGATPRRGLYVTLGGGIDYLSDDRSDLQWLATAGAGYRFPIGRSVLLRPAFELARLFASDNRKSATNVAGLIGLSFLLE